jgi:hypothetical protein
MKRFILLLAALWIFIAAVSPEQLYAAKLYEQIYGKPPPAPKQWQIIVHEQATVAPFFPLYKVDHKEKIVHTYLHPGQMSAWQSLKRFVFMIAGKQSGKTIFGPVWLLEQILKYGQGDYLAISATNDLFIAKMLPEIMRLFVTDLGMARYWPGDRIFELRNPATGEFGAKHGYEHEKMWGRIILRTAESEAGIQSFSAKAAWMDEPGLYRDRVWKDVRGRVSLAAGPVLGTTTPYDMGWLYEQIYKPWVDGDPEIDVIQFISTVNPLFPQAEYDSLQRSLPKYQFDMDYGGAFGRPPAAIYEDFKDALREDGGHKVKRFPIPQEWPRMVSIDPGVVNPGKIWWAHDVKENVYYIYRAVKGGVRLDAKEHAKKDIELAKKGNERVIWWAVGNKGEKYWRDDYKAAGAMNVREPDTVDVEEGIDRFNQLIREHRVFVMDDEKEFLDEIMRYSRVIRNGEVTKEIKDKPTFHLMDSGRYGAVQIVKPRPKWHVEDKVGRYA